MTNQRNRRFSTWLAALPTGTKTLMILALALLPLGLLAILSSLAAARTSRESDVAAAQSALTLSSYRLTSAITRSGLLVRVASDAVAELEGPAAATVCDRTAAQLQDSATPPVRFALYAPANRLACTTPGFAPPPPPLLPTGNLSLFSVDPQGRWLRLAVFSPDGHIQGQLEFPADSLRAVAAPGRTPTPVAIDLSGAGGAMRLFDEIGPGASAREVTLTESLFSDRLLIRLRALPAPLTFSEIMLILLPILLWMAAAAIGWLLVNRLLVRPLLRMQEAIAAYRPGEAAFVLPARISPSPEIDSLGAAFEQVTRTVARHEAELEAAVERQTKLVREVHHRVKNNLQVVASLLNLHARGATSPDVAAAYASIQRRVDALAVVHRNHYAELEENRGVALKPLVSELGASLRASAPAGASALQIRLALEPLYGTQDVAVSVAFLVTEVVEFAMLSGSSTVSIALEQEEEKRARLTFEAHALRPDAAAPPALQERFDRIVTGLSRQLRSELVREPEEGRYCLSITVVGRADS